MIPKNEKSPFSTGDEMEVICDINAEDKGVSAVEAKLKEQGYRVLRKVFKSSWGKCDEGGPLEWTYYYIAVVSKEDKIFLMTFEREYNYRDDDNLWELVGKVETTSYREARSKLYIQSKRM